MKNLKIKTKLILGFMVPILITVLNIIIGDVTTRFAVDLTDPREQEIYTKLATAVTLGFGLVSIVITLLLAMAIIKSILRPIEQLSSAAKEIALGHVNVDMVKYGNDEFGDLVDDYKRVIENIKYQAEVAEEVSNGNLTMHVSPKSPDDLLGNSLKKLVEDNLNALSNISDAGSQVTVS